MWFTTSRVVLTSGSAIGKTPLNAFDNALRDAGIADFNLIKVSSIVPPNVPVQRLMRRSVPVSGEGLMVPTIYVELTNDVPGTEIAVAVGAGLPPPSQRAAGVVFVAACQGTEQTARSLVEEMVHDGMENKGLERHHVELASAAVVASRPWTTAIACALFCDVDIESTLAHAII
jgi:arginine decarboxylase